MNENKDIVVKIEGLTKVYQIGQFDKTSFSLSLKSMKNKLFGFLVNKEEQKKALDKKQVKVLKDINFHINRGEIVGIVGKNGAGKSTLLKIISEITEPTEGKVYIDGKLGSLLEVGTGFHPEFTGRENIYLNGAILGMKRKDIDRHLDEIISFSGVEKFIDTPIKRYSSGMKVRLGFAVAAYLDTDILVVDEVLAVGDFDFQKKSIGKLNEMSASKKRTVLIVSHNMNLVSKICDRVIYLKDGEIFFDGPADECIKKYVGFNSVDHHNKIDLSQSLRSGDLGRTIRIKSFSVRDESGRCTYDLPFNEKLSIGLELQAIEDVEDLSVVVGIDTVMGVRVATVDSRDEGRLYTVKKGETIELKCNFSSLCLCPGEYKLVFSLRRGRQGVDQVLPDEVFKVLRVHKKGTREFADNWGVVDTRASWS